MAHFAELSANNIVLQVVVINNDELLDENNVEQEQLGINFCQNLFGGTWVQTSYSGNFRKEFAGIGWTYNSEAEVFIRPQPYDSWSLDSNYDWQPPTPYPDDGGSYIWSEETTSWVVNDNPLPI